MSLGAEYKPALLDTCILQLLEGIAGTGEIPKERIDFEIEPLILHEGLRVPMHPGQRAAWLSTARFVAIYAGWQSGKTLVGPPERRSWVRTTRTASPYFFRTWLQLTKD